MNADERRYRMRLSAVTLLLLVFVGVTPGWQVLLLADDACPAQPDFRSQYAAANVGEPNIATNAYAGFPVLGLPGAAEPNVWSAPCGPGRWAYTACDPEGQLMTGEVIASDIPAELTVAENGLATLTVPHVTPDWHVIRVRITDTPPPNSETPASRDVLIVFRGLESVNLPPVLLGIWLGGTS